jgi:hypothetical protein
MRAAIQQFVIKPHAPSPSANEIIFASIEKMGVAVAYSVQQRSMIIVRYAFETHSLAFCAII